MHTDASSRHTGQTASASATRPKGFLPGEQEGSFCVNVPLHMIGLDEKSMKFRAVSCECGSCTDVITCSFRDGHGAHHVPDTVPGMCFDGLEFKPSAIVASVCALQSGV